MSRRLSISTPGREISVIVPHYQDLDRLGTCLAALARQSIGSERFEVVVADNRSPAGLAAVERAVGGRARVVEAPEPGAGPARNAGVAASHGALLAFTDCDCVPEAGWLAAGIARLASADIVGGRVTVSVEDEARMTGAEAFERVFAFDNRAYVERQSFTVTANLFCSRAVFEAVGPFRSGVSEDLDWCQRAARKGYTIAYEEAAAVSHPARRDWDELKRKWRRLNAERYALEVSGRAARMRWAARNLAMPISVVAHAPRVFASAMLPDLRTRLRALATLARLRLWRMADSLSLLRKDG